MSELQEKLVSVEEAHSRTKEELRARVEEMTGMEESSQRAKLDLSTTVDELRVQVSTRTE